MDTMVEWVVWNMNQFTRLINSMEMTKREAVHMDWFWENTREEILLKIHCSSFLPNGKLPGGKATTGGRQELVWVNQTLHHLLTQTRKYIQQADKAIEAELKPILRLYSLINPFPTLFPLLCNSFPY